MFLRCSVCKDQIDTDVGVCPGCGLVLGEAQSDEKEMLPDIEVELEAEVTEVGEYVDSTTPEPVEGQGAPFTGGMSVVDMLARGLAITGVTDAGKVMARTVPLLNAQFDAMSSDCTPFEAYLLSLVDGMTPISDIMEVSGLKLFDAVTAFASLTDKGAISLEERPEEAPVERSQETTDPGEHEHKAALGKLDLKRSAVRRQQPELSSNDPDDLLDQAQQALKDGAMDRAREYARLALVHAPMSERAQAFVGKLNDPAHAVVRAKVMLGQAIRAYKAEDYAAAVRLLQATLEEHEPLASAHHRLALSIVKCAGDLELAERHCARAVELADDNDRYQRNLQRIQKRRAMKEAS